jgi:small nuclear ribonucleoprotein G
MSKPQPPDLKKYMERRLSIKLNANRQVTGILRGFDHFMNLVLDEAIEDVTPTEKARLGMVVRACAALAAATWRAQGLCLVPFCLPCGGRGWGFPMLRLLGRGSARTCLRVVRYSSLPPPHPPHHAPHAYYPTPHSTPAGHPRQQHHPD